MRKIDATLQPSLFPALSAALRANERAPFDFSHLDEISKLTGISMSNLADIAGDDTEWNMVTPLFQLRFLCRLLKIDFRNILEIPPCDPRFDPTFRQAVQENLNRLIDWGFMDETFCRFFVANPRVLNIYPVQLTVEVADFLKLDAGQILAWLDRA